MYSGEGVGGSLAYGGEGGGFGLVCGGEGGGVGFAYDGEGRGGGSGRSRYARQKIYTFSCEDNGRSTS